MFAKWRHVQTFISQVDAHLHISIGGDETEFCVSLKGCTGKKCTVEADAIKFWWIVIVGDKVFTLPPLWLTNFHKLRQDDRIQCFWYSLMCQR